MPERHSKMLLFPMVPRRPGCPIVMQASSLEELKYVATEYCRRYLEANPDGATADPITWAEAVWAEMGDELDNA